LMCFVLRTGIGTKQRRRCYRKESKKEYPFHIIYF